MRAEAVARGRHAEIDRRIGQQRLARRQVDDLAIARRRRIADADGEHRHVQRLATSPPPAPRCRRHPTARRRRPDAGRDSDRPAPRAHRSDRCAARRRPAASTSPRATASPNVRSSVRKLGAELLLRDRAPRGGALDPRVPRAAPAIGESHAARHVDEDGDDAVARACGLHVDAPAAAGHDDEQDERDRAQRDEQRALARRERRWPAARRPATRTRARRQTRAGIPTRGGQRRSALR